jgi:hypothetical protein
MGTLADFRRQHPQYDDMSDVELAEALHRKYYSDLPKEDIFKRLEVKPAQAAPAPAPAPATPTARAPAPVKEVKPAGIFDYFTDRQGAIKQDREYRAYLQDKMQRAELEDIETQTGFFDRLGDLFSRGLLSARSGIKDVEAAIETDPVLKKQFTQEARKFAADKGAEITGATTEQDVKDNFLRNVIPYIVEKGAESLPQMFAATNPLGVLGVALPSNLGSQAREAAELQGRQDVSGTDVAKVAPGALAVTALDTLGLGGILAAPAKTALGRIGKAALLEGGTEAIQSAIEYANPRVVTGSEVDAGELFEQAAFGALAGGGIGGGLRGVGEAAAAPFRGKAKTTDEEATINTAVRQEFQRLAAEEVAVAMAANPDISRDQAVNIVMERAEEISAQAADNIANRAEAEVAAEGEADVVPDVDTGMDVIGGAGAGAAPYIGPAPTETSAPELGEIVGGGLGQPVSGVSVPTIGEGAGVAPLEIAPAFDTTPLVEAPTRKERAVAAQQLVSDIVIETPELQDLSKGKYSQAATQMANAATRGEQFDPLDILYNVAGIDRSAPAPSIEAAPAPVAPPAQRTMNDMAGIGTVNPENTNEVLVEGGGVQLTPLADNILKVDSLRAVERGGGRKAMEQLTKVADANGTALQLSPEPFAAPAGKEMTPTELSSWYGEFGFQEQPDGTMARPAASPPPATITPEAVATPQEILADLEGFAVSEAQDRDFDQDAFLDGVTDIREGREPLSIIDALKSYGFSGRFEIDNPGDKVARSRVAGAEWAQDRVAEAQAAPAPTPVAPTPAPIETAAPPPPPPSARTAVLDNARETVKFLQQRNPNALGLVTDLHAQDFSAAEVAEATGLNIDTVRDVRLGLGLPDQGKGTAGITGAGAPADAQERAVFEAWRDNYNQTKQAAEPTAPAPAAFGVTPTQMRTTININGEETVIEGGTEPITDANVDQVVSVKLTKAQLKRLEQAAGIQRMKLSSMQKRIARSRSAEETMSLAGKLMLMARNPKDSVNILTSLFPSTPPPVLQALMSPLETADVVRLGERAGMKNVTRIDNMMRDEYVPYVNRMMQRASTLAEKWTDFMSRSPEGADAMSDAMFFSNMVNADPSLAPTAAEYLKIDQEFQAISAKLAAETDPKKKSNLEGQLTRRRREIRRLYFGATDPDGAKVAGWNDVPPQGKQIFREARDYYRADFQEHYRLLIQRIDDAQFEEEQATRLKDAVDKMFKDASERVVYFPLKRFGDYWVSVGKGKSGEFHMFESASDQDAFIARLRREDETREIDYSKGKDTLRLGIRNQTADASAALKGILDLIDTGGVSDVDLLKDHIFQMYLTALPEADMRRRFIHRQFKTGFSTDTLRTFASTAIASANQLGRLAYNYKFKNLFDQSYAETSGNPSKRRLDTITRELEMRVDTTMSPEPDGILDQAANLGAKATFLFILSSPKSAIMNLTQLHIVGLPTLSAEFGEKATYAMAARYTGQLLTGQRIANPFRNEEGDVQLQLPNFTAEGSAYIRGLRDTDPDRYEALQKAWDYAQEREVTESTFSSAANVYERSNEPSSEMSFTQAVRQGNAALAVQRATGNAVNGMGALFHHAERIGREIMYMSSFELAYDRALAEGKTPAEATEIALPKAAELTNKGMFDFSNWNKSRAAKTPVGKLALQMRSYSISMTSLLFRSFANMVAIQRTKAERLAAARVFMGVGAMTTLYGGFRASQFYLMAMMGYGLYEMVKSAVGDEGDEEQEIEQGYLNPETFDRELLKYADEQGRELSKKDMDYFIRTAWIPETFGPGGTMQEVLGISDGAAKKLATASDIGLPGVFGVDISNSVSLTSLWHPVDTKSTNPEAALYEGIGRTIFGPSGSLFVGAPMKFVTEANAGNLDKAIEAITPAFLRGYVKAERLKDEGLVIGKDRDIVLKDPSFYDTYTLAMQSLGFPEAETSRAMQLDIKASEIEKAVSEERTKLLDQRYRAVLDIVNNPTESADRELAKVERDIEIYNLNYPSNAIDEDVKEKSFQSKSADAAEKMYGLGINEKIPVRQSLAEERMDRFMEEQ